METSKNNKSIEQPKVETKQSPDANTDKPTWKDIEKAIYEIVKVALDYNYSKSGNFLKKWKKQGKLYMTGALLHLFDRGLKNLTR